MAASLQIELPDLCVHVHQDIGMLRHELVHARHEPLAREGGKRRQLQRSAARAIRERLQGSLANPLKRTAELAKVHGAHIGELDLTADATKERDLQQILERLDLPAHRALRHRELRRRAREAQMPGGRLERHQQRHGGSQATWIHSKTSCTAFEQYVCAEGSRKTNCTHVESSIHSSNAGECTRKRCTPRRDRNELPINLRRHV
jgi:hypothetical protein